MKKFSFLALAAAGMLFAACSSDKDVAVEGTTPAVDDGKQFLALNINLPVDNGTITRDNSTTDDNNYGDDSFELNDGLESEYTVNDATLIVFRGSLATEDAATFVAAYAINPEPWKMSADKQVTDYSTKIVQKVGTTVQAGDLAFVVLNKNNLFEIEGTTLTVNGTEFAGTFGELRDLTKTANFATNTTGGLTAANEMKNNGFYMCNAPLTDKAGSGSTEPAGPKVQTLVEIKKVYETEQAAREGSCAEIYVERGMAKVTLRQAIETSTLGTKYGDGVDGVTAADLNLTINAWVLDNTNASSFLVRSIDGHDDFIGLINPVANKYRYIGISPIIEGSPETFKYRTYFAKDTNYEETSTPSDFGNPLNGLTKVANIKAAGAMSEKFGEENPLYCFENTFDVAHQSVNNTTLVRLKVTAKTGTDAEDLYIINGNKSVIYKEADVKTLIANKCVELVKAAGVQSKDATDANKIKSSDFTVTLGAVDADGYKNISKIEFDITAKVSDATTSLIPAAADLLASVKNLYKDNTVGSKNGSILCYEGGVSYYTIRIKHFGDQLTPWKTSTITPVPSLVNGSYPGWDGVKDTEENAAKNYLGRYGVLRNNWYDIRVKYIKYLGESVTVDYRNDPTPDDEIDGYIAVQINILSWAKRTQEWSL